LILKDYKDGARPTLIFECFGQYESSGFFEDEPLFFAPVRFSRDWVTASWLQQGTQVLGFGVFFFGRSKNFLAVLMRGFLFLASREGCRQSLSDTPREHTDL
jgi:hypothetical protein